MRKYSMEELRIVLLSQDAESRMAYIRAFEEVLKEKQLSTILEEKY